MDHDESDSDAVRRYELYVRVLRRIADTSLSVYALHGTGSIMQMKRNAVINAALQEGDEHLPRLQKAFPELDLIKLVHEMRIMAVTMRLGGE